MLWTVLVFTITHFIIGSLEQRVLISRRNLLLFIVVFDIYRSKVSQDHVAVLLKKDCSS